ncbi:MAG: prolipoprotein diacylglyceryl transferase [Desulfobacterales bacterium]|nr:prolipoprotein diacylglyceryl transferase [Desulfobacterales bacterium]
MYPVLFNLGKVVIYTYGLFVAIGFITGITIAKREARRIGEDPNRIMDLSFYGLVASIIGARLFYVITNPGMFKAAPMEIFKIWEGGLVFYGGFLGAAIVIFFYIRHFKMPLGKTADILAPAIAIGHFFGRIGCFFAGCCYGKVCELPWAVKFTHPESLAPTGIFLHPTQLYSALNNIIIFAILWFYRNRKQTDGQVFCLYILLYGVSRSMIELLRDDFRGHIFFGILSVSQLIGLVLALFAVVMFIRLGKKTTD